jgi:8-oxo-dGTP diphosphatase
MRLGQEIQALPRAAELSERSEAVHVVAGILRDAAGRILISQRLPGRHMAGRWEFPGGKLHAGELQPAALARELAEELGVAVRAARPLIDIHHRYADREIVLHVWAVERWDGDVQGREGQALQWIDVEALRTADLLEADRPILAALALPDCCLVTGELAEDPARFIARLETALDRGITLVQLRAARLPDAALESLAGAAARLCTARGARLLVNGDPRWTIPLAYRVGAHGVHVPSRHLERLASDALPPDLLIGASAHDARELEAARGGANFAVLGPVRATPSHAAAEPLGWTRFAALVRGAGLPVYAIGGVGPDDLSQAWEAGAQGVAGIRAFWSASETARGGI